ncbi:hypothetical protein PNEG_03018 [Pneumocystis murina B123]|uniref:Subtelomeric hrmA-associated cluster protein AFUB-079030/YDR124W-like helical bundle domain-containing protein n=1 Tax=Pneumocystis murina (strain B123) TaxID=1069680 RepID=M7NMT0_PNEMU|nr:hypothetical protein PNEG_03018 [Pneumocystis murina B123]EMR08537.1 hypothetical protein PNEG_03018 [Pneumocystis murina B123]
MPRIPVRVEPYSSPSHQNRHFKCKRDRILRALCKSCYINKSNFAILLVNSRGDYETYASEAFQGQLKSWFNQKVLNDAQKLALAYQKSGDTFKDGLAKKNIRNKENIELKDDKMNGICYPGVLSEDDVLGLKCSDSLEKLFEGPSYDKSLMSDIMKSILGVNEFFIPKEKSLSSNTTCDSRDFQKQEDVNKNSLSVEVDTDDKSNEYVSGEVKYRSLVIGNTAEVIAFMESRFKQLQQSVCKIVAKAWIKVIEPKKQTRYPYNRGDKSKPSWWPVNIRHKEPDHLMKSERIGLLLTMLRCSRIPINRLELATAEISAFMPPNKTSLLREIYQVARQEERMRNGEIDKSTEIYITLTAYDLCSNNKTVSSEIDNQFNQHTSSSSAFLPESSIQSHQSHSDEVEPVHNLGVVQKHLCSNRVTNEQDTDLHKDYFPPYTHDSIQVENQIYSGDQNHLSSEYLVLKKHGIEDMSNHTDVYAEKDNNINSQPLGNFSVFKKNMNDSFYSMNSSDFKEGDRSCYPITSMFPLSSDQIFNSSYDLSLLDKSLSMHPKHVLHNYSSSSDSSSNSAISTYSTTDLFSQKNHQHISEMFSPNNSKYCLSYSNMNYSCFPLHPDTFYNDGSSGACFSIPMKTSVDPSDFPDSTAILQIKYGQDKTAKKAKEGFVKDTN